MVSNELSRSTLLRKDRDELVAIAEAMGGKPGSRLRKAQVVDTILDLAGVNENAAEPDELDTAAKSSGKPEPKAAKKDDEKKSPESKTDSGSGQKVSKNNSGKDKGAPRTKSGGDGGSKKSSGGSDDDDDGGQESGNRRRRRRRGRDNGETEADPIEVDGYLDLRDDGYGFLRVEGARPTQRDVYISVKQVRQNGLRKGDHIAGHARPANRNEKNPALVEIGPINGGTAEEARARREFGDLAAVHPKDQLVMERPDDVTSRVIDLLAPIGKGQRCLIVSPPRTGATPVLHSMIRSIEANEPDVTVMVVLLDERPEEVTDVQRLVQRAEVVASPFGRPADEHILVANMSLERAKRQVEAGNDVVLVVDGLSRLARAHNSAASGGTRTLAGGVEPAAVYQPKRLFGSARCFEDGGSLTVIATVNAASGAKLDDVVVAELIDGANTEIHLDRALADAEIEPPIVVESTGTRRPAELVGEKVSGQMKALRASLVDDKKLSGIEALLARLEAKAKNSAVLKG